MTQLAIHDIPAPQSLLNFPKKPQPHQRIHLHFLWASFKIPTSEADQGKFGHAALKR
jgi:hypothetical protein